VTGVYAELAEVLRSSRPAVLVTVIDGPGTGRKLLITAAGRQLGSLGDADLDERVRRDARGALSAGLTGVRHYGAHGEPAGSSVTVFVESFTVPRQMIIFGAVDFAAALSQAAKLLKYSVTVCDARPIFATRARFPQADEVIADWPQRLLARVGPTLTPRDAVCVLTHDAKFDVPAIVAALGTDVGYIGVMGSRNTHRDRLDRLAAEGVTPEAFDRLHAPIGLDIGALTPEETAISICAEIIADRSGLEVVRPLRQLDTPIHH
jgi:xanthine dehydrogenase accessory factor